MADFDTIHIKQIEVNGATYPIDALYLEGHSWSEIQQAIEAAFTAYTSWSSTDYAMSNPTQEYFEAKVAHVPYGVKLFWDNGAKPTSEATRPAYTIGTLTAANADHNKIYLVCVGTGDKQKYDEYIATEVTNLGITSWVWERLGSTDVDLSNYPTKDVAGKAGVYTTSSTTSNTGYAGNQTASGTATVTLPTTTITSTSNVGSTTTQTTTSSNGAAVITPSMSFSGTKATLTATGGTATVAVKKHTYQPAGSISGSQTVEAHAHTTTLATDDVYGVASWDAGSLPSNTPQTIVTGSGSTPTQVVTEITSSASSFLTSVSKNTDATVVTGISSGTTSVFNSATVSTAGVLSFATTSVLNTVSASGTTIAITGLTSSSSDALTSAAVSGTTYALTSLATKTVYVFANSTAVGSLPSLTQSAKKTFITGITINSAGGHTISGSNFTFTGTTATLSHDATGAATTSIENLSITNVKTSVEYTPQGSVTGSFTIPSHSHTVDYVAPVSHTHTVTIAQASLTGTASVAVASHSHSMEHTHTVTVPNCTD